MCIFSLYIYVVYISFYIDNFFIYIFSLYIYDIYIPPYIYITLYVCFPYEYISFIYTSFRIYIPLYLYSFMCIFLFLYISSLYIPQYTSLRGGIRYRYKNPIFKLYRCKHTLYHTYFDFPF